MKVVLDCNVLISAGISKGTCREVLDEVIRFHQWYYSLPTYEEFAAVTLYPHLQRYQPRMDAIAKTMENAGIVVKPDQAAIRLPDPDDAVYLQTAVAAGADVLVTGNKKDFPFDEYQGIQILSPRAFLQAIRK